MLASRNSVASFDLRHCSSPPNGHGVRSKTLHCRLPLFGVQQLRKPELFIFEDNIVLIRKNFVQNVEIFIAAAHVDKDEKTKAYIFLNLARREAIEMEKLFLYTPAVRNSDSTVLVPVESH